MYWNNKEVDTRTYPNHCPGCASAKWKDTDWETGLVYCFHCGWYPGENEARQGRKDQGS